LELEELVGDVVVVAHGAGVALFAVTAAAGAQLGPGSRRRLRQPGRAHGAQQQRPLVGALQRRRLPAVEQLYDGVDVVDLDLAADVGAAEPELARRPQHVGGGARGTDAEGGPVAAGRGEARPIPELDRERPLGDASLDLAAQSARVRESHPAAPYNGGHMTSIGDLFPGALHLGVV
jgi:hypothetical protein